MKKQLVILLVLVFVLGSPPMSFVVNSAAAQTKSDLKLCENVSRTLQTKTKFGQFGIERGKLNQFQKTKTDNGLERKSIPKNLENLDYVSGEVLVKFKSHRINLEQYAGRIKAGRFAANKNLDKKEDIRKSNISVLKIKDAKTVEEKIAELKNDPSVEYVQPNYQYYPLSIDSNDTWKNRLWGLDNTGQDVNTTSGTSDADIDAPEAWAISEGNENEVIVAVIDNGVAYNHPDLADNMWDGSSCLDENGNYLGGCNHGYDYEDGDLTPLPTSGSHGTHIAGTIGAVKNNSKGIIGVAPNVKIMAIKTNYKTDQIIKGINFAENNGAKIINASWARQSSDQLLYDAISNFSGLFIAVAGNESTNNDGGMHSYPSDYDLDNIISVTATNQNDNLATFSNYGVTSVDVGAPGVNIYSTISSGTNFDILNETFESVTPPSTPNEWTTEGTPNYWGTYGLDDGSFWGNVLYGDYSHVPYENNMDSTITLPSQNLNDATSATINFWSKCDTEYTTTTWYDYMALEFSNDGGNIFTEILKWDEAYLDSLNNESPADDTGGSVYYFQNLSIPNEYLTNNFKLRFRWHTDSSNYPIEDYDGCLVDDIKITKTIYSDGSDERYGYKQGTSMAAPHVAGLAGLIWGYKPELSYSEVKDVILSTGDSLASLAGKTVSGKRINAFNALDSLTPPVISNVQTATTTPTSTFILWSTDKLASSKVAYSTTTPVSSTIVSDDTLVTDHSIELTGLTASTTYYFYMESTDEYGSTATSTEQSFVTLAVPDTTSPIITLNGLDTINISIGENYEDAGATALDDIDGDITESIVVSGDTVNTNIAGTYTITYNVLDSAGNAADQVVRTVIVSEAPDETAPVITLLGNNPVTLEVGTAYTDAGATANDNIDGDISASIAIGGDAVDVNALGTYTVTYNVTDSSGNPATENTRTVNVVDTTVPVITLLGENPVTIPVNTAYEDAGATALDNYDGDLTAKIVTVNSVDTSTIGTYQVSYNITDNAGNPATEVIRTVNIVDTTAPVIALLGNNPVTLEVGTAYTDAGATANDNIDGDITDSIVVVNNVDFNTVGSYTVTYNVSDSSGNTADEVSRTVNVTADNTLPTITLNGGNVTIYKDTTYEDMGATASDNSDGNITANIVTTGLETVDTNTPGVYTVNYNVTDNSGNAAVEVSRTVTVLALADNQTTLSSDMTLNASSTEVMISSNAPGSSTISIPTSINNANLNVSALMSGTDVTLPTDFTINSETSVGEVNVQIPQNIQVSGEASWDGIINLPQVQENTSITVTPDSGCSAASVTSVLEIGYGDVELTFDQAVRIKLTGQAGRYIGYSRNGTFTPITATCLTDSQEAGNTLTAGADCKIDVGSDLIIWTKHFTKFATYTQTANQPAPTKNGGGGGGGYVSHNPVSPSVVIDNGENTTYDTNVKLDLVATNMNAIYSPKMMISNSANFTGSEWISYATSTDWTLSDGVGVHTVYVKFKNRYGTSAVASDVIELKVVATEETEQSPQTETQEVTKNEPQSIGRVLGVQLDMVLSKKLSGRLLLQVEQKGAIWYVDTVNYQKYQVTWNNALLLFKKLALGISDADLAKIPVAGSGQVGDWSIRNRLKGKFLLQVEQKGAIWYVDMDGYRYSVTWNNLLDLFKKLALGITDADLSKIAEGNLNSTSNKTGEILSDQIDRSIAARLKGKLLLQVEQGGAIWYVEPGSLQRYNVTWTNALALFRKLSLGITDSDLLQIPIVKSGQIGNWEMRNRLKGKLLLQVQQHGSIWYIDDNGYRHSVTWNNLMPLFESLALGITNADLSKIPVGSLEGF